MIGNRNITSVNNFWRFNAKSSSKFMYFRKNNGLSIKPSGTSASVVTHQVLPI